ncbi:LysR substrate-binding domain-containing protein [Streptomyces sp. NPDC055722]
MGYGNRTVADRAFAAASVARRIAVEITELATGVAYVRNGLGVALLPRFALGDAENVAALTVDDARPGLADVPGRSVRAHAQCCGTCHDRDGVRVRHLRWSVPRRTPLDFMTPSSPAAGTQRWCNRSTPSRSRPRRRSARWWPGGCRRSPASSLPPGARGRPGEPSAAVLEAPSRTP